MPSILPGYEYDIFISYRHKDNRSGWVTEFVEALKNEIEATFKEDISIYFDSNPHDGLNDNHDVDASLKEKVKCLVFIPIVSQTYCDPEAFAWKSELLPFLKFAESDNYGLDIKVGSGNVTKRTLPVLIHDIDAKDRSLFETQTDGFLRSIDFIYSETGVNRPLLPTDKKEENSHKTEYRNQVNKVANAVKDIVYSMSGTLAENRSVKVNSKPPISKTPKGSKSPMKWLGILGVLILLSAVAYFANSSFSNSEEDDITSTPSKALAVMYFDNLTGNETLSWLQAGMVEMLITNLAVNHELDLLSSQGLYSIMRSETGDDDLNVSLKTAGRIAEKAKVNYMVVGSYLGQDEKNLRVNTQLIEVESGKVEDTWVLETNSNLSVFELADTLSYLIREKFGPVVSDNEPNQNISQSLEAQKHYIEGLQYIYRADFGNAVKSLEKAVSIDTAFAIAYYHLSIAASYTGVGTKVSSPRKKALENKSRLNREWADFLEVMTSEPSRQGRIPQLEAYVEEFPRNKDAWLALGEDQYHTQWQKESVRSFRQAVNIDPFYAIGYFHIMDYFLYIHQMDSAEYYATKILELEPENLNARIIMESLAYYDNRDTEEYLEKIEKIALDSNGVYEILNLSFGYIMNEEYAKAEKLIEYKLNYSDRIEIANAAITIYMIAGKKENALDQLEDAILQNPSRSQLLYELGILQYLFGDYSNTLTTIERMEQYEDLFEVEHSRILHLKAITYMELERSQEMEKVIEQLEALRQTETSSVSYFINDIEARIQMKLGNYGMAVTKFRESLKDLPAIEYNLVDFYDFTIAGISESLYMQGEYESMRSELYKMPIPWGPNLISTPSALLKYEMEILKAKALKKEGKMEESVRILSDMIENLADADSDFHYLVEAQNELLRINNN